MHVHVGRLEQIRGQQVLGHSLDIDQVGASCAHSPQLSALSYDALHFHPSGFMHHTKPWYNPQNHSLKTHHQGTAELPLGRENSRGNKITKLHEHKVSPSKTITVIAACATCLELPWNSPVHWSHLHLHLPQTLTAELEEQYADPPLTTPSAWPLGTADAAVVAQGRPVTQTHWPGSTLTVPREENCCPPRTIMG